MNKDPTFFGKTENLQSISEVNIAIVKFYKEMCESVIAGQGITLDFTKFCFLMLDESVQRIWMLPEVEAEFEIYDPLYKNFIYDNCKHHFEPHTDKKKTLFTKTTEICIILTLFDYFVKHRVKTETELHFSKVKTKFRSEFLEWYRDEHGESSDDKSVRDYLKEFLTDWDINDDLYVLKINSFGQEIKNFFVRNKVKEFKSGYSEIQNLFQDFHDDVMNIANYKI